MEMLERIAIESSSIPKFVACVFNCSSILEMAVKNGASVASKN